MKSYKRYFKTITLLIICFTAIYNYSIADNFDIGDVPKNNKASISRSDSIDVLHYFIQLDMTDFSNQRISGSCDIRLVPKVNNISQLYFDLLRLTVDSIVINGNAQIFAHNDTLVKISLSSPIGILDTTVVKVYYKGRPVRDNSWGGFYFQGNYAYNLGVAFDSKPHNYGRVWFPCFDNFVERSTYSFEVLTDNKRVAHCNGVLVNETVVGTDSVMRRWEMMEEIPSYLACIAVSDYETVRWSHNGVNGPIPIEVAARAADTTNMKQSFLHLNDAIDAFENAYGAHQFSKIGYSIVPFNAGAMEHATNIAYPRYAVNGSLDNETLMAHELAHHWWGDLVTCETSGEMWLNEGMASYSEQLFLEHVYGQQRYVEAAQENLMNVLQYAHIREETYRAITGLPHSYTYGMHTYDKGAVVAYNLRSYLGDAQFFSGLQGFLNNNQFQDINSVKLRDYLNGSTGQNLNDFFDNWVFDPGFSHFEIDSMNSSSVGSNYEVTLFVRQKLRGAPAFHENAPLQITFFDETFQEHQVTMVASGEMSSETFTIPVEPTLAVVNANHELNMAITDDLVVLKDTGDYTLQFGKMNIKVNSLTDSALLRVEHNWVSPDPLKTANPLIRMSNYRYWTVKGMFDDNLDLTATVFFDGRNIRSGGDGHLDFDLLRTGEDSLLLMYRPSSKEEWMEYRGYEVNNLNSISDRYGSIIIQDLKPGQYTIAKGPSVVGLQPKIASERDVIVFPNPAKNLLNVSLEGVEAAIESLQLISMEGKLIEEYLQDSSYQINTSNLNSGTYNLLIKLSTGEELIRRVVISK